MYSEVVPSIPLNHPYVGHVVGLVAEPSKGFELQCCKLIFGAAVSVFQVITNNSGRGTDGPCTGVLHNNYHGNLFSFCSIGKSECFQSEDTKIIPKKIVKDPRDCWSFMKYPSRNLKCVILRMNTIIGYLIVNSSPIFL